MPPETVVPDYASYIEVMTVVRLLRKSQIRTNASVATQ